jgi:hypothetical protein
MWYPGDPVTAGFESETSYESTVPGPVCGKALPVQDSAGKPFLGRQAAVSRACLKLDLFVSGFLCITARDRVAALFGRLVT